MTDEELDDALIAAAFDLGAEKGWHHVTAPAAAQRAGLELEAVRPRFANREAILAKFGALADAHALHGAAGEGSGRDRLFDIMMRRFDFLHRHRAGVTALLGAATREPALGVWLARETLRSMAWMLEGAGLDAGGFRGALRMQGALAVWAWGMRAWLRDESEDLAATMAAVDVALGRADQIAGRFNAIGPGRDGFVPETNAEVSPGATSYEAGASETNAAQPVNETLSTSEQIYGEPDLPPPPTGGI